MTAIMQNSPAEVQKMPSSKADPSTGGTKVLLIGYPLSHSLSPLLHNSIYQNLGLDWKYETYETKSLDQASIALKQPMVLGYAVTMPFKVSIMDLLDELTPVCKAVGSCNTVMSTRGRGKLCNSKILTGDNTDCIGIREAIHRTMRNLGRQIPSVRQPALVIGAGGTTRSAVYALHTWLNAGPIFLLNRLKEETDAVVDHFRSLGINVIAVDPFDDIDKIPHPQIIVGCVPDIQPTTKAEEAVRQRSYQFLRRLGEKGILLDMCYKPRWTSLLQEASNAGWNTVEGIEVMIDQGVQQDIRWTGMSREQMNYAQVAKSIRES